MVARHRPSGPAPGLEVGRRFGKGAVELLGSSTPIYLLLKEEGTAVSTTDSPRRSYARHWTPIHLDFVVDDIDASVQKAIAAGALLEKPVRTARWGKLAVLSDPFGHGFCFVQFLGRGYDEIADVPELHDREGAENEETR